MTNRVKADVSPKGCRFESQGMRPSPSSASSPFSDPKPRMGTLKYVLPSTATRTASLVPFAEPLPSEEKVPRDNPTDEVAVADRETELVEAELVVLIPVKEALVAFTFADKTNAWVAVAIGDWNELKEGGDWPPTGSVTV